MRSFVVSAALALAAASPLPGRDRAQERRSLGADSIFGPGIVDLSANGEAVKLRLTRPAHVVAIALSETAVAQVVLPRRGETRLSRVGDQWIDLPWAVTTGSNATRTVTFRVGRVGAAPPVIPPSSSQPPGTGTPGATVTLVIVSDGLWSRDAIVALLPTQPQGSPMAMAQAIAAALVGDRADTCAAYLVRW